MKRVLSILGGIVVCVIVLPLLVGLFFGMPIEFGVSTWHNWRVDSSVKGVITHSEVIRDGGLDGSSVSYSYTVDGVSYDSSRWRAGLLSNSSREAGGGDFAKRHLEGTEVDVHYDASDPSFSLLELGWPKWSLGFSMVVLGMSMSHSFKHIGRKTKRLLIGYPISKALAITGFLTIMVLPPTLNQEALGIVFIAFVVIAVCALVWLLLGKVTNREVIEDKKQESDG